MKSKALLGGVLVAAVIEFASPVDALPVGGALSDLFVLALIALSLTAAGLVLRRRRG